MNDAKSISRKEVEAYFCSWCFPGANPETGETEDHADVIIKYTDDTWEEIFRMSLKKNEGISVRSEKVLARVVLEHFLQSQVSMDLVMMLVNMPASSLCRLVPRELETFRHMNIQLDLPGLF